MNSNEIYLNGDKWNITEALEKSYVAYIIITHQSKNTNIFHLLSFLVLSAEVLSEVFYFQLKNKPLFQSDIKLHLFTNSKFKPLRYFCDFFVLSSLLKLVNKSS